MKSFFFEADGGVDEDAVDLLEDLGRARPFVAVQYPGDYLVLSRASCIP